MNVRKFSASRRVHFWSQMTFIISFDLPGFIFLNVGPIITFYSNIIMISKKSQTVTIIRIKKKKKVQTNVGIILMLRLRRIFQKRGHGKGLFTYVLMV